MKQDSGKNADNKQEKILLSCRVCAKSKCPGVRKNDDHSLKINLCSAPEKGKANEELRKILSDYFGVSKGAVRIIKGLSNRDKIIELTKKI
jgi:uncharacterized protein (TIGR00251 family)